MADRPADGPETPPDERVADAAATDPSGAGLAANVATKVGTAGATSIVAIGQTLDDPLRAIVSVTGPSLIVVWRWLVAVLQTAAHLWLLEAIRKKLAGQVMDDAEREELQQKIRRARAAVMDKLTRFVGGGK